MRVIHFFIFSNIYVALPVSCLAIETYFLFNLPIDFLSIFFVYFSTLFLYSFHRYIGVTNTPTNDLVSARMIWSKKNLTLVLAITILSGILSMVAFFIMPYKPFFTLIPCAVIALGYSVPIWLKNGKLIRLRDINGIKIVLISIVVASVTTLIPLKEKIDLNLFFTIIARVFFVMAITIPFDIRDIVLDKKYNLKTIPSVFGIDRSKNIATLFLFIFIVITVIGYFIDSTSDASKILALSISGLVAIPVIRMTHQNKSEYFFAFAIEGMMIAQFLLVFIFTFLATK